MRETERVIPLNIDTGEISDQHYTRSKKQDEGYRKSLKKRQHDFTFSNMLNIPHVIANVDDKYCGYLLYLQCFIGFDGTLTNPTHSKTAMSFKDIMRTLNLKKTTAYDFLSTMIENGIISEEYGEYRINPTYHFKGATSNKYVVKTFTKKVRDLYSPKTAKKLGFIYKLMPFIHLETNTICGNPYENNLARIEKMTKKDIADITGVSEKTVYSYIRSMKLGDEYVFAEINVKHNQKARYYKINPFIFYRKSGVPDATLREIFVLGFSKK